MFVLRVLPLGADAFLEEVVVRFDGEFGSGCDVVLDGERRSQLGLWRTRGEEDAGLTKTPQNSSTESKVTTSLRRSFQLSPYIEGKQSHTSLVVWRWGGIDLSAGRLREPQRPMIHQRVLDVEVVRVMEDSNLFGVLVLFLGAAAIRRCILVRRLAAFRGDRNCVEGNWRRWLVWFYTWGIEVRHDGKLAWTGDGLLVRVLESCGRRPPGWDLVLQKK